MKCLLRVEMESRRFGGWKDEEMDGIECRYVGCRCRGRERSSGLHS